MEVEVKVAGSLCGERGHDEQLNGHRKSRMRIDHAT